MMQQKVLDHQDVFGVLLQQVGTTGEIHDYTALISELKSRKIVVSVAADIMALVLLTAPGKQGADIVFGSRNALAYRWATVAHTRHSLRRKTNTNAQCGPYYRCIERCSWQHRSLHGDADSRATYSS